MIATATVEEEIQPQEQQRAVSDQFTSHLPGCQEDRGRTQLREARQLQRLIFRDASAPEIKPSDLACLARAWCDLQESIRKLRGIPLPGQLRPDLVPGKRGKREQILDVGSSFAEAAESPKVPPAKP